MNSNIRRAALKILLIQEEFTEKEVHEAIKLIQRRENSTTLFQYFSENQADSSKKQKQKRDTKPFDKQRSKAVSDIENKEPEKFAILSEFDTLLRKGRVLKRLNDIKEFANRISKDFPEIKSRKDGVSKLMSLLVGMSVEQIKEAIKNVVSESEAKLENSEYQELAQFIIQGNKENSDK